MITVFGSINMDLVLPVPSIPRPGETVLCPSYETKPGGKGANQAIAACRAGAQVAMIGAVGRDSYGERLRDSLERSCVDVSGVRDSDQPTGIATITVDPQGENAICATSGANGTVDSDWVSDAALAAGNMLVLQMEVPPEQNWALIDRTKRAGGQVMLNLAPAAPIPETALAGLDYLAVNRIEAASIADGLGWPDDEPAALAQRLARAASLTCVITLGGDGALAAEPDGKIWRQSVLPVTPVDTTGAGDTFAGVLAAGLDGGEMLPDALRLAAVASGLACTALGAEASIPQRAQIEATLDRVEPARLVA